MCTGDCEVGQTTHASADHYTVVPKDRKGTLWPLQLYSIDRFVQCLSDVKMWAFNDSVCSRIVTWNADVMNVILLPKILQGLNTLRPIIRYDFQNCSPSTQNILKHPFSESDCHFDPKLLKFDVVRQRTTTLYDVFVPVQFRTCGCGPLLRMAGILVPFGNW